jgi:8-oxo-dGTP pyrophosphatase MutT (NUDIX family)
MKIIEKEHWRYIDDYHRKNRYTYPNIKFYDFIIESLQVTDNECLIDNAREYYKVYDKYKKSLPTSGVILLHRESILLIRNYSGNVYSLPKGKLEMGENLQQTAAREMKEETGLDLSDILPDVNHITIHKTRLYIVESDHLIKKFSGYNYNEISEIKWFKVSYIADKPHLFSKQVKATINELKNKKLL